LLLLLLLSLLLLLLLLLLRSRMTGLDFQPLLGLRGSGTDPANRYWGRAAPGSNLPRQLWCISKNMKTKFSVSLEQSNKRQPHPSKIFQNNNSDSSEQF
jgi:hypothetical protein